MKRITSFLALSALLVVAGAAFAQNEPGRGRYVVLPKHDSNYAQSPSQSLLTWNGALQGSNFPFVMVGTDPSKTNTASTVTVYIIPVNICITVNSTKTCFDPKTKQSNGATAIANVQNSPIFQNQQYTQNGTNIGDTQYEDAVQRSNFWTDVMTNTDYHILLKPVFLPEITADIPASDGQIGDGYFGINEVALVNYFYVDAEINAAFAKLKQVNPSNLLMIMTYNTYLYQGNIQQGCCIGGYHSASGAQTYGEFTYTTPNTGSSFSQDVSALSHELGEWIDDPLINGFNDTPCGALEVGDPIEGESSPHLYGDYTYTLNGFTYHLQDLASMKYFGQTPDLVNNSNWTFQGQTGFLPGLGTIGECSFGA